MIEQYGIDLFVVIAGLIVTYLVCLQVMFSAAKKFDTRLFEEMGSPHIILNNRPFHTWLILKTLFRLKHAHSASRKVTLWGNISLFLFLIICACFVLFFYEKL